MRIPKLHIICGECGDAENMVYTSKDMNVIVFCGSCETEHILSNTLVYYSSLPTQKKIEKVINAEN